MDVKYQRDLNHNYMIVPCEKEMREDSYEIRMIFANKIPGLLPCHLRYLDGKTYLGYDVTSRQSLSVFCESRKPGKREMQGILGSILTNISQLEEYLLDPDHLILDPQFILINCVTLETELAFAPFYRKEIRISLKEVVEYLLNAAAHDDRQGIVLGYRLSHALQEGNTDLSELMDILYDMGETGTGFGEEDFSREYGRDVRAEDSGRQVMLPEDAGEDGMEPAGAEMEERFDGGSGGVGKEGKTGELKKSEGGKSIRRVLLILLGGTLAAAILYIVLHFGIRSGNGGLVIRILLAVCICTGAVCAAIRIRNRADKKRRREDAPLSDSEMASAYGGGLAASDFEADKMYASGIFEIAEGMADTARSGENPTVLLTGDFERDVSAARLIPEDAAGGHPVITLGEEALIGKHPDYAGHVIRSQAVSRMHARIRRRQDGYFLRDLNSTNGTRVNGKAVFGDEEVCLKNGDRITFADTVYVFEDQKGKGEHEERNKDGIYGNTSAGTDNHTGAPDSGLRGRDLYSS